MLQPERVSKVDYIRNSLHAAVDDGALPTCLTGTERKWLDDECVNRYLRASKNDDVLCVQRLINTLIWRREYKPSEITEEDIIDEARSGKEFLKGFDRLGRPILYLIPARENSKDYDRQLRFVVFNLEKAIKLMKEGVESLVIIIDYKNVSVLNAPPLSISKRFLSIIGDHYPERLGISFIMNPTWYLWVFFRILRPFMDPITLSKVNLIDPEADRKRSSGSDAETTSGMGGYVSSVLSYISPEELLSEYGGKNEWKWNFESYWAEIKQIH